MTALEEDKQPAASELRWAVPAAFLALALLYLSLALRFPLAADETYYWEWSRRPAWGYYDQGPLIAWWIRASCLLFGDTQLGIRFGIVAAAVLAQAAVYGLARDLYGRRTAAVALIFSAVTPLALAGGFVATYDPLVVLFWSLAMYLSARAFLFGSRGAWLGVGAAAGLGLLSKHTMALFGVCILVALAGMPEQRRWLRRPEPYVGLLIAFALYLPNLIWQSQHGWMTFGHLFHLAGSGRDQALGRRIGDYVGSQIGVITPLLCCGMLGAIVWAYRRGRRAGGEAAWYLFSMSAPVLLFFLAMAFRSKVQANWAVCGWLAPAVAYAAWLRERAVETPRPWRTPLWRYAATAGGTAALLSLLLILPGPRSAVGLRMPRKWDQMNKFYGGAELGAAADAERARMLAAGSRQVAVGAATYDNASRMAFYMRGRPAAFCLFLGTRLNSYVLWNAEALPPAGGDALVVDDFPPDAPKLPPFREVFDRVEPVGRRVEVHRPGIYQEPVHTYYLYRCYGYRPSAAAEAPNGG